MLVNAVNSEHIFSKIDTDSRDGHNESLRGYVYPMIAQELIRRISRGSPFHSLSSFFNHFWFFWKRNILDVKTVMKRIFPTIEYSGKAKDALEGADACLVMTEWDEFKKLDSEFEVMKRKIVVDGRRVIKAKNIDYEGLCW